MIAGDRMIFVGLSPLNFTLRLQIQQIDDEGTPIGDWVLVSEIYQETADRTPQRWTFHGAIAQGRYQARVQRLDTKNGANTAAHSVYWTGLRGHMPGARSFPGVTLLAVKARATGNLNGASSRQFNVEATRKLPFWNGTSMVGMAPSRDPCDAAAYVCLSQNGARLSERQVDLRGIYTHSADYGSRGWFFDAVFDTSTTCWEALSKIGRCVVAQPVVQGPRVRLVRDLPATAPAMIFTPRNIRRGTLKLKYKFPDEKTADAVIVEYINRRSWKPETVTCKLDGSTAENPATIQLFGCTNRQQARFVGFMFIRANRYRRRVVPFGTEMEGLLLLYGDQVRLSHDMPQWGQSAEAIDFDAATRRLVVDQQFDFSAGSAHYIGLRKRNGTMAGPFAVAAIPGEPHSLIVGAGEIPPLELGGDAERTHVVFGPGATYAKPLKVTSIIPRSLTEADVIAIDDDDRMYADIPPE